MVNTKIFVFRMREKVVKIFVIYKRIAKLTLLMATQCNTRSEMCSCIHMYVCMYAHMSGRERIVSNVALTAAQ